MEHDLTLPRPVVFILRTLVSAGHQAYIVGGAVRDLLLTHHAPDNDAKVIDFDFTTNARPEQIQALFPDSFYENEFGTVSITHQQTLAQSGWTPDPDPAQPDLVHRNHPHPGSAHPTTRLPEQPPSQPRPAGRPNRIIDLAAAGKVHHSLRQSIQQALEEQPAQPVRPRPPDYQITTFRAEGTYRDFRRPSQVSWGESLHDDLSRRDFTINAIAIELSAEYLNNTPRPPAPYSLTIPADSIKLVDPFRGRADLQAGVIRTVGDPAQRFQEDALRMLRAIRLSVQLNMGIADQTFDAIKQHHQLIRHVSWERIGDEVMKMFGTKFAAEAIELLDQTGLLTIIMPELLEMKGVEQGGHHTTDVWVHSLDSLRECPSPDPIVKLATLLHDVSKPQTQRRQGDTFTFYNHEVIGARVAKNIAKRLKLSKKKQDRVFGLVRHHMFHYQPENTAAAIRRFMRQVGLANLDDILDVREADRLGSGARRTSWRLEEMKQRMIEQLHQPLEVTDLAVNGRDLIQQLGIKPGPQVGATLRHLFELVLEHPEKNTPDQLLEEARQHLRSRDQNGQQSG